ncbi:MAG: hypothetical protein IPF94_07245 [Betaproteobacteria bacterium]|nr:hypothetical protein [Betaproteobacteria bacterium]
MTIDLRGIGDAVRAAAACRGMGVAQLVRRALVMSLDLRATAMVAPVNRGSDRQTPDQVPAREIAKLTLRLSQAHADALMLNAGALGLSYGDYVGRLVAGSRLPQSVAERQADRAALLASNDRMAALSTDLVALVTLLHQAKVEAGQAVPGSPRNRGRRDPSPPRSGLGADRPPVKESYQVQHHRRPARAMGRPSCSTRRTA